MQLRFTAAGKALFDTNPTAFEATRLVLGDAYGYALGNPPTALQGNPVFDETETLSKEIANTNTLRFTRLLDSSIGTFAFGEAALYSGGTLVAIGVNPTPILKNAAVGADNGNTMTLNFFLSYTNTNSYGFVKLGNSDSRYQLGQVNHPDYLDPPYEGDPNVYVVNGLAPTDVPTIGFSDVYGRWNFTSRPQRYYNGVVLNATYLAVDIPAPHGVVFSTPTDYILQFISGALRGYCRQLVSIGGTFFQWNTPTLLVPAPGDEFIIVGPQLSSISISGQTNIQFQDEGVNLGTPGTVNTVNITGAGVTASRAGNTVSVNVPTPSIPAAHVPVQYQDEGIDLGTAGTISTINVIGNQVDASRVGNVLTLEVFDPPAMQPMIQFQDEGNNLGAPGDIDVVNYTGAGVTVTEVAGIMTVNIPGASGGGAAPHVVDLSAEATILFNGAFFSDWDTQSVILASPYATVVTNPSFFAVEVSQAGVYRIEIHYTITPQLGAWPEALTVYGVGLDVTSGFVVGHSVSTHTITSVSPSPADILTLASYQSAEVNIARGSDAFLADLAIGSIITPKIYAANYVNNADNATPSIRMVVTRLG